MSEQGKAPADEASHSTTQDVRKALQKIGISAGTGDDDMSLSEQGIELARSIQSTSGVVGLLAVAMTAGMFVLVWQLMGGQQDALATVATHQTAMARRLDSLGDELEDVQKEITNLRFALGVQRQTRSPYSERDYRGRDDESDRNQ